MSASTPSSLPAGLADVVRSLPQAAKDELAKLLTEPSDPSPPFELSPEWREEIARRIEAVRSGRILTVPVEESIARLRRFAAEGARA